MFKLIVGGLYVTTQGAIVAFISASFGNGAQKQIEWFIKIANSLGIETIWLKEKYESRPTEDKIKDNLKNCNTFIQILTEDVEKGSKENGWLGNEVAWADAFGIKSFALFAEEGVRASGVITEKTDCLPFGRNALHEVVPQVNQYLLDLKMRTLKISDLNTSVNYEKQKASDVEFEKMLMKERKNFVKTSIIKINNEFEPVTICRTNNYEFKLNGCTVSLKTGESLIIPHPLPEGFEYLMIAGWGFAKKEGTPMGDINSKEELGRLTFLNSDQQSVGELQIAQPGWKCEGRSVPCSECNNPKCIKFLNANPDLTRGGDPSIKDIREKGIVGKIKSLYRNIHTHWIDLNIYVCLLKIPQGAKYIKIALEKPNQTHISLNIAEIIPIVDEGECAKIRKALEGEIKSETIKNDEEVKTLLEIYRELRNNGKSTDELWSCAAKYIENDIYMASKLIKYALILEDDLDEWKKEKLEKLMRTLNEKAENDKDKADAAQACVLLSHFCGLKAKNKGVEYIEKAGDMIEKIWEENRVKYVDELMNLQWRCYESAANGYNALPDFQKALKIRVKLNKVFERITESHPFASPIIDNVFENFNETTNLIEKCKDVSLT